MKRALQLAILCLSAASAWAVPTGHPDRISQPTWSFTVGPGTIVSVQALDLPFVGRSYIVKYKTEKGEVIEIRDLRHNIPVLQGMHGLLTYSTSPEMILNFKVIESKAEK
jgi:aconitase B